MQGGRRHFNRKSAIYQWVPKSSLAASSSVAPPPSHSNEKSRRRRHRARRGRRAERRNWAEMSPDVLSVIFEKLGPFDVLVSAQSVCRSWRRLAHEKETWRKVNFTVTMSQWDQYTLETMAIIAVDRSMGTMEEFSLELFGDDFVLAYMAERCPRLKCLKLVYCHHVSVGGLIEALEKLPLLETLSITLSSFCKEKETVPAIIKLCPKLKSFHLNVRGCNYKKLPELVDSEALAIAKELPMLQELQLHGNQMTNEGLEAILIGCPLLKSLDLRQCFNITIDADALKKRCNRIKHLKLPSDSIPNSLFVDKYSDIGRCFFPDDFFDDYDGPSYYDYFDDYDGPFYYDYFDDDDASDYDPFDDYYEMYDYDDFFEGLLTIDEDANI